MLKMERRQSSSAWMPYVSPLLAGVLTLISGAIVFSVLGQPPDCLQIVTVVDRCTTPMGGGASVQPPIPEAEWRRTLRPTPCTICINTAG